MVGIVIIITTGIKQLQGTYINWNIPTYIHRSVAMQLIKKANRMPMQALSTSHKVRCSPSSSSSSSSSSALLSPLPSPATFNLQSLHLYSLLSIDTGHKSSLGHLRAPVDHFSHSIYLSPHSPINLSVDAFKCTIHTAPHRHPLLCMRLSFSCLHTVTQADTCHLTNDQVTHPASATVSTCEPMQLVHLMPLPLHSVSIALAT